MLPIRDSVPRRNFPIATCCLILANAVVFLCELMLPETAIEQVFYLFGIVPARFTHPDWAAWMGFPIDSYWPYLTSMFLHGGWLHIFANMWTLWIFGDNVEDRMGPGRFTAFYLLCGLAAGFVHVLTNPDSTVPTVGASGAIAGVMGAYFVLFPNSRLVILFPVLFIPFFFELPAITYLLFWALSQFFSGTLSLANPEAVAGIAWWAHVGGFIAGMALQLFFIRRGRAYRLPALDEYEAAGAWMPYHDWRQGR
jgi:membrane associated rhomboid family serine protease